MSTFILSICFKPDYMPIFDWPCLCFCDSLPQCVGDHRRVCLLLQVHGLQWRRLGWPPEPPVDGHHPGPIRCVHLWRPVRRQPDRVLVSGTLYRDVRGVHEILLLGEKYLLYPDGGRDPEGSTESGFRGADLLPVGAHHSHVHGVLVQIPCPSLEDVQRRVRHQHGQDCHDDVRHPDWTGWETHRDRWAHRKLHGPLARGSPPVQVEHRGAHAPKVLALLLLPVR